MTGWLPRKVAREPAFFERVPDILRDWVAYAGRRRGVPRAPLREAVAAVKRHSKEMLDAASAPGAWGPAKAFALAAQQAWRETCPTPRRSNGSSRNTTTNSPRERSWKADRAEVGRGGETI